MITREGIAWLQSRLDGIFAARGLGTAPRVEQYGPWTGKVVFPDGMSDDDILSVSEEFVNHPSFVEGDNIFLGVAGEELGEEYTDEEARTFIFDISEKAYIEITQFERDAHNAAYILKPKNPDRPLQNVFLPMKYRFFDDIAAGRKTVECRKYTQTYVDKLLTNNLRYVTFQRGYEKGAKQMTYGIIGIELADADGERRYAPEAIPDFAEPEWIVVKLGKRLF